MVKVILAMAILLALGGMTGCNKKEEKDENSYKTEQDVQDNIQSKKKVIVDGEEMDEYTMNDGLKVRGAGMDGESEDENDSE